MLHKDVRRVNKLIHLVNFLRCG